MVFSKMVFSHARARGLPYVAPGGRVLRFKLGLHPSFMVVPRGPHAEEYHQIHELRGISATLMVYYYSRGTIRSPLDDERRFTDDIE